jgi:DNA-directed RNA polymerase alpha subunit
MELVSRTQLAELFGCHKNTIKWNFVQFMAPKQVSDREIYYYAKDVREHLGISDFSEKFIKLKEAAEILGCSRNAIMRLCDDYKSLRYYRLSHSLRGYDMYFLVSQLKEWKKEILQNRDIDKVINERWRQPADLRDILRPLFAMTNLSERDMDIAHLSIAENKSDIEIGKLFAMSHERVRQIRNAALKELAIIANQMNLYKEQLEELGTQYQKLQSECQDLRRHLAIQEQSHEESLVRFAEIPISDFIVQCSVRAKNSLKDLPLKTLADLANYTKYDLIRLRNCGLKTVNEIISLALSYGLAIRENEAAY